MSIYQDWTPVNIGNGKNKMNNKSNYIKIEKEVEDGVPPTVLYWTTELRTALQQLRQAKGISQKDLAKQLNIPSTTINDIEANKSPYNPSLYKKIYRFMGGDPSSLNFPKVK